MKASNSLRFFELLISLGLIIRGSIDTGSYAGDIVYTNCTKILDDIVNN